MTREQALTMIIASIAMEENALSRIIDAEGDKLRYILDKCQEACDCRETPEELLKVNESVTRLLDVAAQNQTILRNKLALAIGAGGECPAPCPPPKPSCPPPCSPCSPKPPRPSCPEPAQKSFMQLRLPESGFLWKKDCTIPWEYAGGRGSAARWSREAPSRVELDPARAWSISCTFNICDFLPTAASGRICLESAGTALDSPPLCFSIRCAGGEAVTLQYSTLLLPGSAQAVSFRLHSRTALCVEQAQLNIVEL